jgi:SulP family sulfate permease
VLGRLPGTEAYLNVARHPGAESTPGVLVVRIDAQFYFGNVSFLKETLRALEQRLPEPLTALVLDASGINQLDSSAEAALNEIDADYAERGIRLYFSHVKGPVRDVMYRTGLLERLAAEDRIQLRTHDAVLVASGQRPKRTSCPAPAAPDLRAPADRIGCGRLPELQTDRSGSSPSARRTGRRAAADAAPAPDRRTGRRDNRKNRGGRRG